MSSLINLIFLSFHRYRMGIFLMLMISLLACQPVANEGESKDDIEAEEETTSSCTLPTGTDAHWIGNVNPNCFNNIDRLRKWNHGTNTVTAKTDPTSFFTPISPGSIVNETSSKPIHLYVVTHGWAPGLLDVVKTAKHNIQWWDSDAHYSDGTWESSWFWTPTIAPTDLGYDHITVSETGLIQQLIAYENTNHPEAQVIVLAYSWIDDSATPKELSIEHLKEDIEAAQTSEAYTNINGLRLSQAIQEAVGDGFLAPGSINELHILGHSHGSKVATVAAMALQKEGLKVNHLTTLDSPENETTLTGNAANLLGHYFNQMTIDKSGSTTPVNGQVPIFVDNYPSMFDVRMVGGNCDNVVNVTLYPEVIYSLDEPGQKHSYSGTWYAGAAIGASATNDGTIGLDWPPVPDGALSRWYQNWDDLNRGYDQEWHLTRFKSKFDLFSTYSYSKGVANVYDTSTSGPVSGEATSTLKFPAGANSKFAGTVDLGVISDRYGLAYDINWTNPQTGDYLVVVAKDDTEAHRVFQVFDGKSMAPGWHNVSVNSDYKNMEFEIHLLSAQAGAKPSYVEITNFEYIQVEDASE